MRLLISVAATVLVGVVALTACNSKENTPKLTSTAPPQNAPAPPGDNVRRITPAELRDEMTRNDVVIIDVRGEAVYKVGHIKGSRLIPSTEILAHVDELPRNKMIATYCA